MSRRPSTLSSSQGSRGPTVAKGVGVDGQRDAGHSRKTQSLSRLQDTPKTFGAVGVVVFKTHLTRFCGPLPLLPCPLSPPPLRLHSPLAYVDGEWGQVRWRRTMASTSTWTSATTPTPSAWGPLATVATSRSQRREWPLSGVGGVQLCGCLCACSSLRSLAATLLCWVRRRNTHS